MVLAGAESSTKTTLIWRSARELAPGRDVLLFSITSEDGTGGRGWVSGEYCIFAKVNTVVHYLPPGPYLELARARGRDRIRRNADPWAGPVGQSPPPAPGQETKSRYRPEPEHL